MSFEAGRLGAARMFSTALATIKFLSLTRPWIGFSSFLGTGGFLNSVSRAFRSTKFKFISHSSELRYIFFFEFRWEATLTFCFVDENWLTSALLSEGCSVWSDCTFRHTECGVCCLMGVAAPLEIELA